MPPAEVEHMEHLGAALAFMRQAGRAPTFVWLGGFRSDMTGTKAGHLAGWAAQEGQGFVRFDYSGHGQSGGRFEDGGITRWLSDALAVIDGAAQGPLVLVGSSMGAWVALLAARERRERVKGLLLIAPAVDFTERLVWNRLNPQQRREMLALGRLAEPCPAVPEPEAMTRALIEDGRKHLIMDAPFRFEGPVHILQGQLDETVPCEHAMDVCDAIKSGDNIFRLIDGGDHRLSRDVDLETLAFHAGLIARQLAR